MSLRLVDESIEDVVNLFPDVSTEVQKFSINSMQGRLEEVPLAWVFRVKQLEKLNDKSMVNMAPCNCRFKIRRFQKAEKELVYELEKSIFMKKTIY